MNTTPNPFPPMPAWAPPRVWPYSLAFYGAPWCSARFIAQMMGTATVGAWRSHDAPWWRESDGAGTASPMRAQAAWMKGAA